MEQQNIPPVQTVSSNTQVSSNNNKLIILTGIILILLVGLGGYMLGSQSQQKKTNTIVEVTPTIKISNETSPTTIPTVPVVNTTPTLKHYTRTNPDLALDYPSTWNEADNGNREIDFNGPEGFIHIIWGGGFGGGPCTSTHTIIQTKSGTLDMCDTISNGIESLRVSNDGHQTFKQVEGTSIMVQANINSPYQSNRDTIIKILESLE